MSPVTLFKADEITSDYWVDHILSAVNFAGLCEEYQKVRVYCLS